MDKLKREKEDFLLHCTEKEKKAILFQHSLTIQEYFDIGNKIAEQGYYTLLDSFIKKYFYLIEEDITLWEEVDGIDLLPSNFIHALNKK